MTTPNQPNDERHQTNGVTERVSPSANSQRPVPRPSNSADSGQGGQQGGPHGQGGPQGSGPHAGGPQAGGPQGGAPHEGRPGGQPQGGDGQDAPRPTVWSGNEQESPQKQQGGQGGQGKQSPYQDGWSQLPQREPQSNLYRPGHAPVGRGNSGGGSGSGGGLGNAGLNGGANASSGGGLGGAVSNARTPADLAAKAARKEAAMVKSVGIDGPTRSIARPELVKDMPDLSEIRHPTPQPEQPVRSQQGTISPTVPVAVAAAVTSGDPLRATVQIRRIDPWSTLKITLVISIAMFFVWMLAVGLLYIVLAGMGVWDRLNSTFTDMVAGDAGSSGLITASTVFGYAGVVGLINIVLFTALGTVGTFIYNQCCDLVGGVQVTLADPD